MKLLSLDDRHRATVLAALRLWSHQYGSVAADASHELHELASSGDWTILSLREVDKLSVEVAVDDVPHYSKRVEKPVTVRDGFINFIQMIINRIEGGEPHEALMLAVDLLDTISGNANPYKSVTAAPYGFEKVIADLKEQHQRDLAAAISKALEDGIREGKDRQKKALAKLLINMMEKADA